ncbi:unnamed protein product [Phaeothamnion confervicola]
MIRPAVAQDHCLVHPFIRRHGRRPTAEELADLVGTTVVPAPRASRDGQAHGLVHALRREVARLVARL